MKRFSPFLTALLSISILAAPISLTTGCKLSAVQQDSIAKIVARRATVEVLTRRPDYRPAFSASVLALDLVLKKEGATREDFVAAAQALKIKELRGQAGALLLNDLLDLIDIAIADKPWIGSGESRFRAFLVSVSDGLSDGLALTVLEGVIAK